MLELKNISYEVEGGKEILRNVSLTIDDRFVAITGPNGGGKSTLAKIIAGIYQPTGGQILLDRELNDSLSGGELKRIEIAMVLARGTKLSIFDEPEAGIDLWSFQNLIRVFEKMYEQTRGSILIISHQERILNIADKIIYVKGGQVERYGDKAEILPSLLNSADNAACKVLTDKMEGK